MQTTDQPINRTTVQRLNSNRRNAQRSTGPRTAEGKAVSSRNALTHGLAANRTVLPGENAREFQTLLSELAKEFRPATALQRSLVRQLADSEWRLRRIPDFEAGLLTRRLDRARSRIEKHPDNGPSNENVLKSWLRGEVLIDDASGADPLSKLSRYESRLTRNYFKALEHLRALQTSRSPQRPTANHSTAKRLATQHATAHHSARRRRTAQRATTRPTTKRPTAPKPRAPKKKI